MTQTAGWPDRAPTTWWRHVPDSSNLERPRVLSTTFVPTDALEEAVTVWSASLGVAPDAHLPIDELGLTVVTVGDIAVVAAAQETLPAFEHVRAVIVVAHLDAAHQRLLGAGVEVLGGPTPTPVGRHLYARTVHGTTVEWVEHRPRAGETARSGGIGSRAEAGSLA